MATEPKYSLYKFSAITMIHSERDGTGLDRHVSLTLEYCGDSNGIVSL